MIYKKDVVEEEKTLKNRNTEIFLYLIMMH